MAGTNELALINGGLSFSLKKGGEAKVRGDEIKREGLKSITNYDLGTIKQNKRLCTI